MSAQLEAGPIASAARPVVFSWGRVAAVLAIVVAVAALYWPTVRSLALQWEDFDSLTYTHGYLIALISIGLIVRARITLNDAVIAGSARATAALAAASLLWLLSFRAGIEIVTQLLLPLIAWLSVLAVLGPGSARRTWFAFAFLYFAIPVWDFGNELLQSLTLSAVSVALTIAGIPAFVDGNLVHIPSGVFEIAGGCSGLHFFIVATAIAALYGEMNRDSLKARAQLLVLAAALAILCNWARVFWIIRAGYYTEMQDPLVSVSHYYFGWKIFTGMMVVFFLIARRIPQSESIPNGVAAVVAGGRRLALQLPLVVAAAVSGPAWALLSIGGHAYDARAFALPTALKGWTAQPGVSADWQPRFGAADFTGAVTYRAPGRAVEAFTAIYFVQRQNKELVGFGNAVGGALQTTEVERIAQPAGAVAELKARDSAGRASLIWYYYEVEGWRTTRGLAEQLFYGVQSLAGAPLSRVVALRAQCAEDCSTARDDLVRLFAELDSAVPALH